MPVTLPIDHIHDDDDGYIHTKYKVSLSFPLWTIVSGRTSDIAAGIVVPLGSLYRRSRQ